MDMEARVVMLERQLNEVSGLQKDMASKHVKLLVTVTQIGASLAVLKWLVGGLLSVNLVSVVTLIAMWRSAH